MRQVVGFLVHNWPLKIAAVLLATLLYAGLIVSASAESFRGRIPVQPLNQPAGTFVIGDLADVTSVRYIAVGTDRPQVSSTSFTATVDLSSVPAVAGAPPASVPVVVRAVDPGIQVIDFTPSRLAVRLDPAVTRDVPVTVDLGAVPSGLDVREPVVSPDRVSISGPDSSVRFVTAAVARIRIDPSGLDINETVGLEPVDARGEVVEGVDVQPSSARVTVQIGSQLATRTLPVNPVIRGSPAADVEIASVDVQPALVTVEGEADALDGLVAIDTRPVTVAGATADVSAEVGLALPDGVAAVGVSQARVTVTIRPRSGTRTIEAGFVFVNPSPGLAYQPSVDRVLLTVGGTLTALDALAATEVVARLDVAGLDAGTSAVTVTVALPEGVTLVAASPGEVTVTATPLALPSPTALPPGTPGPTPTPTPGPSP